MNEKCFMFFELSEFTPSSYIVYQQFKYLLHQAIPDFQWKH